MTTNFFSSKTIGRSLKEVAVDLIQTHHEDIISRWYHSDFAADLFTWVDKGQNVIKQQLCFNGQVVEWNCLEGLKTGMIIEADLETNANTTTREDDQTPKSESIKFDVSPHVRSVDMALEIIGSLVVEEDLRKQMLDNFCNPKDIKTLTPEEFVKRFGLALKNYQNQDPGFWDSFKKSFQNIFKKSG